MRTPAATRSSSTMTTTSEGGGEEDDGRPTMNKWSFPMQRRNSCINRLLVVAAAALLLVQPATAAAVATTAAPTQAANVNLGKEIDIPSSAVETSLPQTETASPFSRRTEAVEDVTMYRKKDDYLDFNGNFRTVIKRSEKTRKEFSNFIDKTCRDIDSLKTFLSWEQDQFAMHLESNILSIGPGQTADAEVRERLRSLTQPDYDIQAALGSVCKPPPKHEFGDELNRDEKWLLENEVINTVFANLYKQMGHKIDLDKWRPITWQRLKKKDANATESGEVTTVSSNISNTTTDTPMQQA